MAYHSFMDFMAVDEAIARRLPGIVVPQQVFESRSPFSGHPTIRFSVRGSPGLRLQDAAVTPIRDLDNRAFVPTITNTSSRTTIRIIWPGYPEWRFHNVSVRDHTVNSNPYNIEQLACALARYVRVFYDDFSRPDYVGTHADWQLGNVPFDRLYLVELRHVATGSWQPLLCYRPPGFDGRP